MNERINVWGYYFEPSTGKVFDADGNEQPYTFQPTYVIDQATGRAVAANPLQFASKDTAVKVLAYLQNLSPDSKLKLHESVWSSTPFSRTSIEYGIETSSGTVMNAGLVANTLMRNGSAASRILLDELHRYEAQDSTGN